jgi:fluoride exporter
MGEARFVVNEPTGPVEPTDPDVDLGVPAQRRELGQGPIVAAVAVGGVIGSLARYGATVLWPTASGAFPWTILIVNVVGCAFIGAFMVVITEMWTAHRLVRPFFGTGVLGGFTTFSTYAADIEHLVDGGRARTGMAYLALTLLAALLAVWTSATLTRSLIRWRRR